MMWPTLCIWSKSAHCSGATCCHYYEKLKRHLFNTSSSSRFISFMLSGMASFQDRLGRPQFVLPGGIHWNNFFGRFQSSILSRCPNHLSLFVYNLNLKTHTSQWHISTDFTIIWPMHFFVFCRTQVSIPP